jgi:hypothetical protein
MFFIVKTLLTSHAPIAELNFWAYQNAPSMSVTELVSHFEMSALNFVYSAVTEEYKFKVVEMSLPFTNAM